MKAENKTKAGDDGSQPDKQTEMEREKAESFGKRWQRCFKKRNQDRVYKVREENI